MAMSSSDHDDDEVMAEINMTPLVDVMLVLLIIFIVTIPVMQDAVKVQLPQASASPNDARPEHISLALDAQGQRFWNGQAISDSDFQQRLHDAAQHSPRPELHLSADKRTPYEFVAKTMAASQRAGLAKISFVTLPE